jgi:methylthioxylose transferase
VLSHTGIVSGVEPERPTRRKAISVAFFFSALSIVIAALWGRHVEKDLPDIKLGVPPLVGMIKWRITPAAIPASVVAMLIIVHGCALASRLSWRRLVLTSALTSSVFAFLLAASDGLSAVLAPVVHPTEYWDNLDVLPSGGRMLRWFSTVDFLKNYSVHLKGHPPGFILLLKGLAAIGLGRPWVTGMLSFVGVAAMVVGVLVTVRHVVDEDTAQRFAPFLVLAPFSMWLGTSADALFAGVGAVGVALVAMALHDHGRRAFVHAALAGATLGALLFLTYAGASFLLIPGVLALATNNVTWRRRLALGACAGLVILAVALVFRGYGFWWVDGLKTTNHFYWRGTAQFRPWRLFVFVNLGAALIAMGPSVIAGVASLRSTRLWLPVGAALACMTFAAASQYTKGEVERIWVLFYPWVVPAVAVLSHRRRWLAVQGVLVIALQLALVSKW